MKINEITRSTSLKSVKGKIKPNNSILYKEVDLEKIYKASDLLYNAYFTCDDSNQITALVITTNSNNLVRLENVSKQKGLITIILLSILDSEPQLTIKPSEDLTYDGLSWLLNNIRINKYFTITDYDNRPINFKELEEDWFYDNGKIGIIITAKKLLHEEINKGQIDYNNALAENKNSLFMPMVKWLNSEDLL